MARNGVAYTCVPCGRVSNGFSKELKAHRIVKTTLPLYTAPLKPHQASIKKRLKRLSPAASGEIRFALRQHPGSAGKLRVVDRLLGAHFTSGPIRTRAGEPVDAAIDDILNVILHLALRVHHPTCDNGLINIFM